MSSFDAERLERRGHAHGGAGAERARSRRAADDDGGRALRGGAGEERSESGERWGQIRSRPGLSRLP